MVESSGSPRRTGLVALVCGAVVVAVGVALWLMFGPADTRLYESIWELESATFEGRSIDIETNGAPVGWKFDRTCDSGPHTGPGCWDSSSLMVRGGCGNHEASVVYEGSTVRWTGDAREIAPACVGEIAAAVIAVGGSGSFDYSFDGDRLVVISPDDADDTAGSAELVLRPIASVGWGD